MVSLLLSFAALILAYHTFGKVVEGVFGPDDRMTPAHRLTDGVDYVPMQSSRAFLMQLLNIAGTGPIFGALMGACFGPVVFLWIVLGAVLAGGVAFYGTTGSLHSALSNLGQSGTVYDIATGMLGAAGGILAIVGVVACPITSGDTAFRSARLILAEITGLNQKPIKNRLIITIPLLGAASVLTQLDFNVLWRYFSWSNQTLAMITLWVVTAYLLKSNDYRWDSLISAVPATFMSAVSMTYILVADEGMGLAKEIAYPIGIVFAAVLFVSYLMWNRKISAKRSL